MHFLKLVSDEKFTPLFTKHNGIMCKNACFKVWRILLPVPLGWGLRRHTHPGAWAVGGYGGGGVVPTVSHERGVRILWNNMTDSFKAKHRSGNGIYLFYFIS